MIKLNELDKYRESNRLEVKKAVGGLPKAYGRPIPLSLIQTAVLFFLALKNWLIKHSLL